MILSVINSELFVVQVVDCIADIPENKVKQEGDVNAWVGEVAEDERTARRARLTLTCEQAHDRHSNAQVHTSWSNCRGRSCGNQLR